MKKVNYYTDEFPLDPSHLNWVNRPRCKRSRDAVNRNQLIINAF